MIAMLSRMAAPPKRSTSCGLIVFVFSHDEVLSASCTAEALWKFQQKSIIAFLSSYWQWFRKEICTRNGNPSISRRLQVLSGNGYRGNLQAHQFLNGPFLNVSVSKEKQKHRQNMQRFTDAGNLYFDNSARAPPGPGQRALQGQSSQVNGLDNVINLEQHLPTHYYTTYTHCRQRTSLLHQQRYYSPTTF
jgi:hypothetical protein